MHVHAQGDRPKIVVYVLHALSSLQKVGIANADRLCNTVIPRLSCVGRVEPDNKASFVNINIMNKLPPLPTHAQIFPLLKIAPYSLNTELFCIDVTSYCLSNAIHIMSQATDIL